MRRLSFTLERNIRLQISHLQLVVVAPSVPPHDKLHSDVFASSDKWHATGEPAVQIVVNTSLNTSSSI